MFQELFNGINNSSIQWVLTPCNCSLKIQESIRTLIPKVGAHLGVRRFIPSHFPTLPGAWNGLHSWLAPLQALALVMSPRLGLRHVVPGIHMLGIHCALSSYLRKKILNLFFHPWCQSCLLFQKNLAKFGPPCFLIP
jgi:hypothetical protein